MPESLSDEALASLTFISFWIGAVGLVVSIAGFLVAIQQIRKSISAADAARRAAELAAGRMSGHQLLILVGELSVAEAAFQEAMTSDDRVMSAQSLIRWRRNAAKLRGVLVGMNRSGNEHLAEMLQSSIGLAHIAQGQLADPSKPVASQTKRVARAMAEAGAEAEALASQITTEVPLDEGSL